MNWRKLIKVINNNKKVVFAFILGVLISSGTVYAATILYTANQVGFDNTTSGLSSTNVQSAIDEINLNIQRYTEAQIISKPAAFNLGDYFTLVPDSNTSSIPKEMTGYSTTGPPYTEIYSTPTCGIRGTSYYCCYSEKPEINESTGAYKKVEGSTFGVIQGANARGKYCSSTSVNQGYTCSALKTIYSPQYTPTQYNSGSCKKYTIEGVEVTEQTIVPNELTLWRVIGIRSDGTVDAVSEYTSSASIYFKGATGYINYVNGLQLLASSYSKNGYTVRTRMMGYDYQTPTILDTSVFGNADKPSIVPGETTTPVIYEGTGHEYNDGILGDNLYVKDYQLVSNVYKSESGTYSDTGLKAYKVNSTSTKGDYWLSSRLYMYGDASNFGYAVFSIYNGNLSDEILFINQQSTAGTQSMSRYLRPIITLNSNVTIASGAGTKSNPYILN